MLLWHSPFYVAALMLLVVGLALHVTLLRMKKKITLGDGGDAELLRAIRRHGNTFEHAVVLSILALVFDLLRKQNAPFDLSDLNWRIAGEGFLSLGVAARIAFALGGFRAAKVHQLAAAATYLSELGISTVILAIAIFY